MTKSQFIEKYFLYNISDIVNHIPCIDYNEHWLIDFSIVSIMKKHNACITQYNNCYVYSRNHKFNKSLMEDEIISNIYNELK